MLVHFAINTVLQSIAVPDARARARMYQSEVQNLRPCITRQSGKGVALFVAIGMRRHKLLFIGVVDVGWSSEIPHTIIEVIVGRLFAIVLAVHLVMPSWVWHWTCAAVAGSKLAIGSTRVQARGLWRAQ